MPRKTNKQLQREGFDLALDAVQNRRDELFKILASELPLANRPLSQEWHKAQKAHSAICELLPILWAVRPVAV
jgi:hypothetical protein